MKTWESAYIDHVFLSWAVGRSEWPGSRAGRFFPGKEPLGLWYPMVRRLGGPQNWSE
jgi:hypothetical protein